MCRGKSQRRQFGNQTTATHAAKGLRNLRRRKKEDRGRTHIAAELHQMRSDAYATAVEGAAGTIFWAWVPSRKSFLKRRAMWRTWRRRPVPVVRLRLLFTDQLKVRLRARGYPQLAHAFFWMWYDRRPQRTQSVCVLLVRFPNDDVPFVIAAGQVGLASQR